MNAEDFKNVPMNELIAYLNENDCFTKHSNVKILEINDDGTSKTMMEVKSENLNFQGHIHGGALMTMADVTAGTSITHYRKLCVTLNSEGSFLRAAAPGNVYGYGKEIGMLDNITTSEVEIYDSKERLVYKGTVKMFLFD